MNNFSEDNLDDRGRVLPKNICPVCGHLLDAASSISKEDPGRPRPGDMTVCIECTEILIFDDAMKMRRAELNDMMKLNPQEHDEVDKVIETAKRVRNKGQQHD